jgi:hypothetical protein
MPPQLSFVSRSRLSLSDPKSLLDAAHIALPMLLPVLSHTTIKSFPTMISPLKYFATGARQLSSLILSNAGTRCDSTRVLTPASCAIRPTSSTGVWSPAAKEKGPEQRRPGPSNPVDAPPLERSAKSVAGRVGQCNPKARAPVTLPRCGHRRAARADKPHGAREHRRLHRQIAFGHKGHRRPQTARFARVSPSPDDWTSLRDVSESLDGSSRLRTPCRGPAARLPS